MSSTKDHLSPDKHLEEKNQKATKQAVSTTLDIITLLFDIVLTVLHIR